MIASCIFSRASARKLQVTREFVSVLQVIQDSSIALYYDDTM